MTTVVYPDAAINFFLRPVVDRLGIKYRYKELVSGELSSSKVFIMILKELTNRLDAMDKNTLQPIHEQAKKIVAPMTTIAKIAQEMLSPFLAFIPPQYAIIFIAIILIPTVIIPSLFLGGTIQYYLERWLQVPFVRSKREVEKVPEVLRKNALTITQKTTQTNTFKLKEWFDFGSKTRKDYLYECFTPVKDFLLIAELIKETNPQLTSETAEQWIKDNPKEVPIFTILPFEKTIPLTVTMYHGWRKLLPPVLNRTVEVLGSLFKKVSENALEDFDEHPARAVAKYLFIGWLGFLG